MAELFHFPARRESFWRAIESGLRDSIRKAGADDAMTGWILEDLKPRVAACDRDLDVEVPAEAAPQVAEIAKFLRDRMSAAVSQMLLLEIELYAAKFND